MPTKEKQTITLIDPKKANNCAIMLSKYDNNLYEKPFLIFSCRFKNLTYQELKKAILSLDENVIDSEGARGLAAFAPTAEEVLFYQYNYVWLFWLLTLL